MYFSTTLFGYSKTQVDQKIQQLENQISNLEQSARETDDLLREIKGNLQSYQRREHFISDVLLDVHSYSQSFTENSRKMAEEHAQEIMIDAEQRLHQAEETLEKFERLSISVGEYEIRFKDELRSIFQSYIDKIDKIEIPSIKHIKEEVALEVAEMQQEIKSAKNIVTFPNQISTEKMDDLPLYTVE
ncbi:TPA: DivIVA domain-containing protein [Streptococcus suis]